MPIRPNWDGTMPVPGGGRYEWAGFHDADQLPAEANPDRGWVATANEMNLPSDYPNAERTVTYDWYHRYRYDRIAQVLDTADGFTVHDCVQLQTDTGNVAAQEVQHALRSWRPTGAAVEHGELELAEVIAWLAEWDADATANSGEAALYEIWFRKHLRPALLRHALGTSVAPGDLEDAVRRLLPDEVLASDVRTDLLLIRSLGAGSDTLNAIIGESLRKAIDETAAQLGADRSAWRWGDLHRAAPAHPLAAILSPQSVWSNWPRMQPVERPGSGDTVCSTAYDTNFVQTAGASFRIVVDVGDWDQTVAMNAPGQSGRPGDPHWDDLYTSWAAGGSFRCCLVGPSSSSTRLRAMNFAHRSGRQDRSRRPQHSPAHGRWSVVGGRTDRAPAPPVATGPGGDGRQAGHGGLDGAHGTDPLHLQRLTYIDRVTGEPIRRHEDPPPRGR